SAKPGEDWISRRGGVLIPGGYATARGRSRRGGAPARRGRARGGAAIGALADELPLGLEHRLTPFGAAPDHELRVRHALDDAARAAREMWMPMRSLARMGGLVARDA